MIITINNYHYQIDYANNFYKKLKGLMFKKNINKGIFLPKTKSIHTFFMKDNIDIIMINKYNKIIFYKKNLHKNKIIIKLKAKHTIELPKNTLNNIKIDDLVIIN